MLLHRFSLHSVLIALVAAFSPFRRSSSRQISLLKLSAQRNETETASKQFQNSFETVFKLVSFSQNKTLHPSFRCVDSLTLTNDDDNNNNIYSPEWPEPEPSKLASYKGNGN